MCAPDNILYEYALIRFVPRIDREEFINIGLVMMSKRNKWIKALVLIDEQRIKALYPNADIECLRNQSRLFEMKDVPNKDIPVEEKYRWLTAVKSACIQVSPSHPAILEMVEHPTLESSQISSHIPQLEHTFARLFTSLVL